jgi:hypothetical protein
LRNHLSYITRTPHGLGGLTDTVTAASKVIEDPCLGQVTKLVLDLHALEQRKTALGATTPVKGIGLCSAVKPLEIAVYLRRHTWVLPVGGIAFVAGLLGLGYVLGRQERRR